MRNWRGFLGLFALIAVGLALLLPPPETASAVHVAAPAPGASPAHAGEVFHGLISLEGKAVPLPPGEWMLAGRATSTGSTPVHSVALVRLQGLQVDAAVLIQTNPLGGDAAWGKAAGCDRTDLYFARVRYASDHDGSCAYAAYVFAAAKREDTDPAWQQGLLRGAGAGWRFPSGWIEATYRITDPRDALQVRYLFTAPHRMHGPSVRALVAWTESSWYAVGSGFRNRLGPNDALTDWRRRDPEAPILPAAGEASSEVEHLGVKMVTYRIFGTLTDMSVNYLWLGSLPSAGALATIGAIASSSLYFVHELVWSRFEQPQSQVGDLPGVGPEGPGPSA